jgi:hypothetical protein
MEDESNNGHENKIDQAPKTSASLVHSIDQVLQASMAHLIAAFKKGSNPQSK